MRFVHFSLDLFQQVASVDMDNKTVPLFQKQMYNENQNQGTAETIYSVYD